ncbi:MAG: hypothetical protein IJM33_08575 [Bacteroidales bacterium]|nr:hypothetical protein [Bacteroidales bacterium]
MSVYNILSIVIAFITMVCTIVMTKNTIELRGIRKDVSRILETAKRRLYARFFNSEESQDPSTMAFKEAVLALYFEIKELIPDMGQEGYKQEDWLMAEWLMIKKLGRAPTEDEIMPLADQISQIRRGKGSLS